MNTSLLFRGVVLAVSLSGPLALQQAKADTHFGVSVGVRFPAGGYDVVVGADRYYFHRGTFYRPGPRGLVVVRAPRGAIVRALPPYYSRVYVGDVVYFRCGDVYYRQAPAGFVVVEPPVVVAPPPVVVASSATVGAAPVAPAAPRVDSDYQSIWVNGKEYLFRDGQFFFRTQDGLTWTEAPLGAVTPNLPVDAKSVWYQDIEYFESDDVYFRKTPDGYRVVPAPWKK